MIDKRFLAVLGLPFVLLVAPGCERDSALEEAGEDVEEAAEDTGEAVDDATEDITDK